MSNKNKIKCLLSQQLAFIVYNLPLPEREQFCLRGNHSSIHRLHQPFFRFCQYSSVGKNNAERKNMLFFHLYNIHTLRLQVSIFLEGEDNPQTL